MDLVDLKRVLLALGATATLAIFIRTAGTLAALGEPRTLLFLGWCLLPFAHLWAFGRDDDPAPTRLFLVAASAIVAVFGVWVYVDVLVLHTTAQSAIAFYIVPLMQLAVALPAIGAAWMLRRQTRDGALPSR